MDQTATLAREFEQESDRIDQLIWDAMALRSGETALFCGFTNHLNWVARAVEIGVDVTVVPSEANGDHDFDGLKVSVMRGSTSMLPARDASFDVAVAYHYLHEVDPFFHAPVVSELGRVARRCAIVEPAPPSDPLGLRIATLYSRAKRERGQFENYHHIDYWRKLLSIVKSDVRYESFTFTRTPPRAAIRETVALIIDMMAAEETPESYLAELRALAQRPDAQLLPQARSVVVGITAGEPLNVRASAPLRPLGAHAEPAQSIVSPFTPATIAAVIGKAAPSTPAQPAKTRVYSSPAAAELPIVEPRPGKPAKPAGAAPKKVPAERGTAPEPGRVARNAFGLPAAAGKPAAETPAADAAPFGLPNEAADAATEFGWEWETPPGS